MFRGGGDNQTRVQIQSIQDEQKMISLFFDFAHNRVDKDRLVFICDMDKYLSNQWIFYQNLL